MFLVAAVAAATATVAEYFLRNNLSNEDAVNVLQYNDVFRGDSKADVFILGNSQSAYGIIPSYVNVPGHVVHNYSFSGASASFNYDLYETYLRKYQKKPKLIIYAVSWFMFDSKVPPRKLAQDRQFVPWGVEMLGIPPHERLYLIHQRDVLSKMFKRPTDNTLLKDKYDNGFVPLDGKYDKALTRIEPGVVNSKDEINCFTKLLKAIRQDGISLLFIEAPEYIPDVTCESALPNEEMLRSIAKSGHIEYINYNRERRTAINFDSSCFGDWRHLNYAGAQRFSKMLSDDVNGLIASGKISLDAGIRLAAPARPAWRESARCRPSPRD